MATSRKDTPAVQYDITTAAGFLAAFDAEIDRLARVNSWCYSGRETAYAQTANQIMSPDQRRALDPITLVPDADLSDAGKARKAGLMSGDLASYITGAKSAALYGLQSGYVTEAQLGQSLARLGITPPVSKTVYRHTLRVMFDTAKRLTGDTRRGIESQAINALAGVFSGQSAEGVPDTADVREGYSQTVWSWPADAAASK